MPNPSLVRRATWTDLDPADRDFARAVGQRIRDLRKASGLTIADAAAEWGLSQSVIGSYERCDRLPSIAFLHRLARVMGIEVADLLPAQVRQ